MHFVSLHRTPDIAFAVVLMVAAMGCGDDTTVDPYDDGGGLGPTDALVPEDAEAPECLSDDDCDNTAPCEAREQCDLATHTCEPTDPLEEGAPCAEDRVCEEGLCVFEIPVDCTTDEDCDDGNSCNGVDYCDQETGTCQVTTCNDGDPCTDAVCQVAGPCLFTFIDEDGDGYAPAVACVNPDLKGGDCDDTKAWVNPGAPEVCDLHFDGRLEEVDNNCDGYDGFAPESGLPNLYFRDRDEDGYGDENEGVACPLAGYVRGHTFGTGSPGAPERRPYDCFDGPNPASVGADVYPGQGRFFTTPYCMQGHAAYDEVSGWFCDDTGSAATPLWDYNCDNLEELQYTQAGLACMCDSGNRIDCDTACSPPSWSASDPPDCGVTAGWTDCYLNYNGTGTGWCAWDFAQRTQGCR
jgi:hypothetical protein